MNRNYFDIAIDKVKGVLKNAKIQPEEIDDVVLVGGSTRIPEIQHRLQKLFPSKQLGRGVHVDEVVAHGAALRAAIWKSKEGDNLYRWVFRDVMTYTLGIQYSDEQKMFRFIDRGETLPAESKTFIAKPSKDYQRRVGIRVFEGESDFTANNKALCYFQLELNPTLKKDVSVAVKLKLNANGILYAEAKDEATGSQASGSSVVKMEGTFGPKKMERLKERLQKIFKNTVENDNEKKEN